ncbi:MAG: hypothetical protein WBP45_07230 [Daejeonella sp.]
MKILYKLSFISLLVSINILLSSLAYEDKQVTDPDYKIIKSNSLKEDRSIVHLSVFDENKQEQYASFGFLSKSKLVFTAFTNKDGTATLTIFNSHKFSDLVVTFLGYKMVKIPIRELKRKETTVYIYLKEDRLQTVN